MEQILSRLEASARAYEDQDATALQEEARQQYEKTCSLTQLGPAMPASRITRSASSEISRSEYRRTLTRLKILWIASIKTIPSPFFSIINKRKLPGCQRKIRSFAQEASGEHRIAGGETL